MKPVIAYVDVDSSEGYKKIEKEALLHVLEQDSGYSVLEFGNNFDFEDRIEEVLEHHRREMLLCVLAVEDEYEEDFSVCKRVHEITREKIGNTVPVVISPYREGVNAALSATDPHVHMLGPYHPEFLQRLSEWARKLEDSPMARRRNTAEERRMLRHSYDFHTDEETFLGAVDDNHKEVAEYLRLKNMPSLCMKEYFDDCLPREAPILAPVDETMFRQEMDTLKRMDPRQRESFLWRLVQRGPDGVSYGPTVSGFAIDLRSKVSVESHGYGLHAYAGQFLLDKLRVLQGIRRHAHIFDEKAIEADIVRGMIHREVEGHTIPIVRFYDIGHREMSGLPEEVIRELGRYLLAERKYIPVDYHARVIDEEYEYEQAES